MAAAETARLIASLELQDKNFTRGIRQVEKGVDRVDRKLGAFSGFINRNMARAIDTIGTRLVGSIGTGLEEMATLEDAATSVTGAIGQVGKGWTTTADDIVAAANRIESETDAAFDDKAIVGATETLIRYGKVTENNLVPAMEVMTDLAARTGDVDSAATLLAKALADPAKAAGKLARSGVVLTKQQQKQIKAMVEAGDVAGAQTFLLQELAKTTEGAAAASAGPYRDALNKLGDAGEDLRRGFVTGLAPAILEVSDLLTDELAKPSTMETLKNVGKELGGALKGIIGIAKSLPWETIGNSLKLAGTGAKAVLDAFLGLPPWIQTAVLTGWGLNKLTGGKLFDVGKIAFDFLKGRGSTPANPLFVADVTGGKGGVVPGGGGPVGTIAKGAAGLGLAAGASIFIAGIAPVALFGLTTAIINATGKPVSQREFEGRVETAVRRGLNPANVPPAGSRVPAQGLQGDWLKAWTQRNATIGADTRSSLNEEKQQRIKLDRIAAAAEKNKVQQETKNAIENAKSIASRENAATKAKVSEVATKAQATANAVKNAQSIASRENSAQKAEIARAKQAAATAGRNTTNATNRVPPSVRQNAITVSSSMAAAASRIVSAVNSLDLSVNVTTVNRTSTINNRYGPSGGSSTTNRSGELE